MDKLLDKIGLYDFFVRLITGLTIFICADYFEILDFLDFSFNDSSFRIPSVLLGGYFVGVVMEEIVYLIKRISKSIESKKSILEHEKKPSNYQQMKKDLIREGYEGLIENPLMNKVMAGSYAIAFCVFSVICICKLFLCNEYTDVLY